ncbi:MAG TPA: hypothetical protein VEY93_12095, partial [Longimicrobium sp.]|nr:hypothetical protein [Longimicrobium sp.]
MTRIAALFCAAAALACSPRAPAPPPAEPGAVAGDTLRGTVAIVGSEPMTSVVLQTAAGSSTLCGAR